MKVDKSDSLKENMNIFNFRKVRRILGLGMLELSYFKYLEEKASIEEIEEEINKLEKNIENLEFLKENYTTLKMKDKVNEYNKELELGRMKHTVLLSIRDKKKQKNK